MARGTYQIQRTQDATITALAPVAEARAAESCGHIQGTNHYVKLLAQALWTHLRLADFLTSEVPNLPFKSAPLHDMGKVGTSPR